ncbi:type VI secretion system Vgr family protein [Larsenimonas suaedae]|uniref:Type VI secretion system tip protein TssI/VgrG n=1 Tax=Larsenimonas suaedae TaxID=1851019 RepID=A0ABU1GVN6_9GAMM|nr:type VI secretion system tip protein TssI/VgrG [Larsenimonas suaedae]MCM2973215.1 type VI secretion system tip protein VgrG [Larsenimonas suaedae]MDR5896108.1 type VI secretion system tip protein TssI/VgrG [Larsenimonas suaedae]
MADSTGLQYTMTLPGLTADAVAVVSFELTEGLSEPFELTVHLACEQSGLTAEAMLDKPATLSLYRNGVCQRTVSGVVSAFTRGATGARRTRYVVEVRPALWRLSLRQNSRIFQHATPQAIIATLLEERGITDAKFMLSATPLEREYCVQYRENDLAFIERLAAEEGLFYFHTFENGQHQLYFTDDVASLPWVAVAELNANSGGASHTEQSLFTFRHAWQLAHDEVTLKDYTFKRPRYDLAFNEQPTQQTGREEEGDTGEPRYPFYDYPGRFKRDATGEPYTRTRMEYLTREADTAMATGNLMMLMGGSRVTLAGAYPSTDNTDWSVIRVKHTGRQDQALEEDAGGAGADGTFYENRLTLLPGDRPWRPAPEPKPRVDGPQIAVVTGPKGEEIYTDEHGRVKVQFPWDRYGKGDETTSAFLRVSQDWASGSYGMMTLPRIGHEVIVSFLEGDPDQPIVTGRTYHAVNVAPYPLPAHKTVSVWRTQTHKGEGFNELRFEDAQDSEQIRWHAQKDMSVHVTNDRLDEVKRNSDLTIKRNLTAKLDASDHHRVAGERRIKVDGNDHQTIDATAHEHIGASHLLEAGTEVHHEAGVKLVVEAGAEITLKAGGGFITINASGVTIGGNVKMNAGGSPGSGTPAAPEPPEPVEALANANVSPNDYAVEASLIPLCGKLKDGGCTSTDEAPDSPCAREDCPWR